MKNIALMLDGMAKVGTETAKERFRKQRRLASQKSFTVVKFDHDSESESTAAMGKDGGRQIILDTSSVEDSEASYHNSSGHWYAMKSPPGKPSYAWEGNANTNNPASPPRLAPRGSSSGAGGGGSLGAGSYRALRHKLDTAHVFNPNEDFCRNWDVLTSILLIFVALVTPFELGFLETNVDDPGGLFLFVVNRLVDLVFFADIFVQLNTSFVDKKGNSVVSRRAIARRYATSW